MIEVANLTKRFGRTIAVDNLSFTVNQGEIVGFLGPNGAGKTTTMRVLSCYLPPTGGSVAIDGLNILDHSVEARMRLGYMPENVPLYTDLRVLEYLRYRAKLKGLRGRLLRTRIAQVIQDCGLEEVRHSLIGNLSKGFRQRVGLADSLIHDPPVLLLDEPTVGLDPNQIRHIRNLIKGLAPRRTVLLSSHLLSEVEMICERVLIMNHGRIVASDRPEHLVGLLKGNVRVFAELNGPEEVVVGVLRSLPGVLRVDCQSRAGGWFRYCCECKKGHDCRPAVFTASIKHGWMLRELTEQAQNLEDVFVSMTSKPVPAAEEK